VCVCVCVCVCYSGMFLRPNYRHATLPHIFLGIFSIFNGVKKENIFEKMFSQHLDRTVEL